jgi:hypothetical protein
MTAFQWTGSDDVSSRSKILSMAQHQGETYAEEELRRVALTGQEHISSSASLQIRCLRVIVTAAGP